MKPVADSEYMELTLFQVDAFTDTVFHGNPAAVCPLEHWLSDQIMQNIAGENNLSETAFFVKENSGYRIRWFTPVSEVDLCGHATLASAQVIFNHVDPGATSIRFDSRSGELLITRRDDLLAMDFPAYVPKPCTVPDILVQSLDITPERVYLANYYLVVFRNEQEVKNLNVDFTRLRTLENGNVIVTAPGMSCDFVSRFFAPGFGIDEDPVTGSAHCALIPYWADRLKKRELFARQISSRTGELYCELRDDRVIIAGKTAEYMQGKIRFQPGPVAAT